MPTSNESTVSDGIASAIVVESTRVPSTLGESRLTFGGFYSPSPSDVTAIMENTYNRVSYDGPKPKDLRREMHPFYFSKINRIDWIFDAYLQGDREKTHWKGFCAPWTGFPSPGFSHLTMNDQINRLKDRCSAKHRSKIKDQSVNLAQSLAERQQLVNMIASRVSQLVSMVKRPSIEKLRKFFGVDSANGLSNTVLEIQYGWRPLVSDINGLIQQLDKTSNATRTATSRVFEAIDLDGLIEDVDLGSDIGTLEFKIEGNIVVKRTTHYAVALTATDAFKQLGGLNVPYLLYELVPYSFIVDWFSNVGSILNSLDADVGLDFTSGCQTVFIRGTLKGKFKPSGSWSGKADYYRSLVFCERQIVYDFPDLPSLEFKNPFSLEHALNAIALLGQKVTK